jgi:hypothetical protein
VEEPLRIHVLFLEDMLQQLQHELTAPGTPSAKLPLIEEEIRIGQEALNGYRHALEREQQLRKSDLRLPSSQTQDTASRKL